MKNMIDARGLSCPQPVIITKRALENMERGEITTVVDNETARDNVVKLARSLNCSVDIREVGGEYHIHIEKGEPVGVETVAVEDRRDSLILITSATLGRGNEELGRVLAKSFFYSLTESTVLPQTMIFINSGVKLTVEGSEILSHLRQLENSGVEILSCGTCLDYYEMKKRLAVGGVTNMYTIIDKLMKAGKTITL